MVEEMMSMDVLSRTTIPANFFSYKRGQRRLYPRYALLSISNVGSRESASQYVGNGVLCYKVNKQGEARAVHGVITKVHGMSGAVRARFTRNLDSQALGTQVFVKLYKVEAEEI
ncbi:ribosomal protein L35Ae [Ordospora colligata]|uniref:Ribosomal protein L35Ae n=1 Tax=Ordospora colligata OC4 TaxID=1354746 RepID=A0A0B2ULZ1_9MICR|nr:ribosomal protein L35Ae [Ordospora colligata OC4]KHN70249.1 ribosomal protein L35Ae [Ordospora colligata OC4]TBU16793.1 ribosomal protein L35Ae [Ordospora colligata]TBU16901.1 ribosomal protein L35Ae [Ordospora colligata]TBU19342.1 ribosomal protein L35Ae [Ordospora colligata]